LLSIIFLLVIWGMNGYGALVELRPERFGFAAPLASD
jgi:hypothetical protein